ncbi:MAG TPA: type II toxin-antitoxin system HicA family toxin [Ectothiorhodospiraceae bacterium]|nr:type II toxin-antitoxin system HicA family toxin [Ectothiorhodospiraceae bacterium]
MSKKHEKIYKSIMGHHTSSNIHWREVESLLHHLGAELHESKGARVVVHLGGKEITLHHPHQGSTMGKNELHQLGQFLSVAGVTSL